jgi:hypothetical protein
MVNFTNTLNLSTHNRMDPYNFNLKDFLFFSTVDTESSKKIMKMEKQV